MLIQWGIGRTSGTGATITTFVPFSSMSSYVAYGVIKGFVTPEQNTLVTLIADEHTIKFASWKSNQEFSWLAIGY